MNINEINTRFFSILEALNLTAYKLSKDIGISQSTISGYRNNKSTPKRQILQDFAARYNVNLAWLLTGEGEMFNKTEGGNISNVKMKNAVAGHGSSVNISNSDNTEFKKEIEALKKRVSELETLVEQKDKMIEILLNK